MENQQEDLQDNQELAHYQLEPEKILLEWQSPSRLFKKRNREFYTTVGVLVILLSVILLFAKEFLLIGVIMSFAFVTYVLASVHPENIEHQITNKGIRTGNRLFEYALLGRFWFEEKWNQEILQIENSEGFPSRLTLLMPIKISRAEIEGILSKYLLQEKPLPTPMDKAAAWLQEKVPLETNE